MLDPRRLFENYFDNRDITTPRLVAFGVDHLNRMTQANAGTGNYNLMIEEISGLLGDFGIVLSGVEGKLRVQKGLTQTADEVMERLKDFMKDHEDELRYKLKGTPGAILSFYPQNNRTQYNRLTKERMPVVAGALAIAAASHTAELGAPLSTELQDFAAQWQAASAAQEQAMGSVSSARDNRDLFRPQLNTILMRHVHQAGSFFGDDVAGAMSLFNFTLLWYRGERNSGDANSTDTPPAPAQ